jgi:hypothetical protein
MVEIGLLNKNDIATLFPSWDAALLFGTVILIWVLSEIIGGIIIPSVKRKGVQIQRKRTASNIIAIFAWIIVFVISIVFARRSIAMLPSYVTYIGSSLVLVGIA